MKQEILDILAGCGETGTISMSRDMANHVAKLDANYKVSEEGPYIIEIAQLRLAIEPKKPEAKPAPKPEQREEQPKETTAPKRRGRPPKQKDE